ncbi:MAG: ABC transporter permease [Desulfobacterium sp.]|nr:ABC transporter permease [Desulfobacterium sp.]
MAIPLIYNVRSIQGRFSSTLVALLSIAGVIAVLVATMAMAKGFKKTLVASGSSQNAIVLRGGATSEMESSLELEQIKIIGDDPRVARDSSGRPMISAEVVVIASLPLRATGTDANVQIRGVSQNAFVIRDTVKLLKGRFFTPGLAEIVVGKYAHETYRGFDLDKTIHFGGIDWTIVGILDAGGSAFDSESWCDANVLNQAYKRPENLFQSMTARLISPESLKSLKDALNTDPRLTVTIKSEIDYYADQSVMVSTLINVLGFLVAGAMGIGAIFGALNTMYSAVSTRNREIATLRAIGFRERDVVISFLLESLLIAFLGGLLGSLIILPINGYTASTINWQTFSHMSFAFAITPDILIQGILFSLLLGFFGGLFPAIRAAHTPIAPALRGL